MAENSSRSVAIVGAGIIGMMTAYWLVERGCRVTVLETHDAPLLGITAAGFGSLTPYSDPFFQGEISIFAGNSIKLYREKLLPKLGNERIFLSEDSLLQLLGDEREANSYIASAKKVVGDSSEHYRLLDKGQVLAMEPNLTEKFHSAIEYKEPWLDLPAFSLHLLAYLQASSKFSLITSAKVTIIEERKSFVRVNYNGEAKRFDAILIATGAGLAGINGVPRMRIELIRGDGAMAVTQNRVPLVKRHIYMGKAFITPRLDGQHLLGATYEVLKTTPEDSPASERMSARLGHLREILSGCENLLPRLTDCEVTRLWHGWRASTPDRVPYVGLVPEQHRVWAAVGFIGLGVTLAPAVGAAIADAICELKGSIPSVLSYPQPTLWASQ